MLKQVCEGIERNQKSLTEFAGSDLERASLFSMFKTLMTTPETDDERFASFAAQFDKMLQDTFDVTIDDVMDALDNVEYDADGNYVGGGEDAAKLLDTTVSNLSDFLATMGEDVEGSVNKFIVEACKVTGKAPKRKRERKGKTESENKEFDIDSALEKLGDSPSFKPVKEQEQEQK